MRDGLDEGGKPFYWMNVGNTDGAVDDYDEHWGESAYVVAMAYHHDGGGDAALGRGDIERLAHVDPRVQTDGNARA